MEKMTGQLSYDDVLLIASLFRYIFKNENLTVNLGGLEPLLWHESPSRQISDLVRSLTESGLSVNITTNGSLLAKFAHSLIEAGVAKIRISIHSLDEDVYYQITGQNVLKNVMASIEELRQHGVKVSLNRTILNGYTDDMPAMLDFVMRYNLTLKLYDLLWTDWIAAEWEKYYISWQSVVKQYVLPVTKHVTLVKKEFHRPRLQYHLIGGGTVEVKVFNNQLHQNLLPCSTCSFNSICKETIGAYIYINPNKVMSLCHHRPDLSKDLSSIVNYSDMNDILLELESYFYTVLGERWKSILAEGNLDFYINSVCNYYCGFPDRKNRTERLWCMSPIRVENCCVDD